MSHFLSKGTSSYISDLDWYLHFLCILYLNFSVMLKQEPDALGKNSKLTYIAYNISVTSDLNFFYIRGFIWL